MDEIILKLLGLLEQLTEEKGVPKTNALVNDNIVKSDNSPFNNDKKVKETLSNTEKGRLEQTFSIFNKLFFDYQKKVIGDHKEKTLIKDIAKKQTPPTLPSKDTKSGMGLMSMIIGGLTLLGASIGGIVASLGGFFGDMGGFVKVIGKLGFIGALKIISKTILGKLSLSVLKRLPIIGGIIGLGFAVKAFMNGDIFLGISELISGLLNFVPGVGPILSLGADVMIAWAQGKGMFDKGGALSPENGWNTIKGWMGTIGKTIMDNALYLPIIGTFKRFGMAVDSFKSGNIGEGIKQIGLGLFTMIPGGGLLIKGIEVLSGFLNSDKSPEPTIKSDSSWGTKIMGWIQSKLKDLPWFIKKPLAWFGIIPDDQVGEPSNVWGSVTDGVKKGFESTKQFVGSIWDKVKGPMKDSVGVIGQFATDAWNNTKDYAAKAWDIVNDQAPKIWESVKDVSQQAWDVTKQAGSWFSDTISSMADKTKNLINDWIPKIVDTISGITDSAMKVLKSIADKIGGWIANLFSPEDQSKMKQISSQASEKQEMISNITVNNANIENLVKSGIVQNQWMENLYKSSQEQVRLLGNLVNLSNSSLSELKRMSGNGSSANNTIIQQSPDQSKTPMVPVGNNRTGYTSSAYAFS